MNKNAKFALLIVLILGTLVWIGTSAVNSTKSYYKTISEVQTLKNDARSERLRVAGDIQAGSIHKAGSETDFTLIQEHQSLKVAYYGEDPLPDTFRDGAQALAEGKLGSDGVFRANHIQAKCSSKYQSKPGEAPAGLKPVTTSKASL